jgi:hypothetical protein
MRFLLRLLLPGLAWPPPAWPWRRRRWSRRCNSRPWARPARASSTSARAPPTRCSTCRARCRPLRRWRAAGKNPGLPPTLSEMTALVQELGLSPDTPTVVVYTGIDATDFGGAARVYWTLKSLGAPAGHPQRRPDGLEGRRPARQRPGRGGAAQPLAAAVQPPMAGHARAGARQPGAAGRAARGRAAGALPPGPHRHRPGARAARCRAPSTWTAKTSSSWAAPR